jgi:L-ascorbate metabolism protein UlaG (beta-lactamase superfamily)
MDNRGDFRVRRAGRCRWGILRQCWVMIEVTWLGHSAFSWKLESGETILLDPWLGNPKAPAGYVPARADLILISHGHGDHTIGALELAARFDCPIVAMHELATWSGGKGAKNVLGMNKGGTARMGSVDVTMVYASHSSTIDFDGEPLPMGEAAGYVVRFPDGRGFYFAGDTDVFGDMALIRELYAPDVVFLPIGDLYTMGPKQAALACKLLGAKKVVPMHYGTFPPLTGTPEALRALVGGSVDVLRLEPGVPAML